MTLPFAMRTYGWAATGLGMVAPMILRARVAQGKEVEQRLMERFGQTGLSRPGGPLIWMHGASVGEILMAASIADELRERLSDPAFLFTTQTITGGKAIAPRLGARDIHQFLPLDTLAATSAFLTHWRPDMGLLMESELWPNLIRSAAERQVPLGLLNARMNEGSRKHWRKNRVMLNWLLGQFFMVAPADAVTGDFLAQMGAAQVLPPGNLKQLQRADTPAEDWLHPLQKKIGGRPVWLAASTHAADEAIIFDAHKIMQQHFPGALLILVPRHPIRGEEIAKQASLSAITCFRRHLGDMPEGAMYLADTIGEMPLWLALSDIAFMGGSFGDGKGHNPLEAVQAGVPVLTGPGVESFSNVYAPLFAEGAARPVHNAQELADTVMAHWQNNVMARGVLTAQVRLTRARMALLENLMTPLVQQMGVRHART